MTFTLVKKQFGGGNLQGRQPKTFCRISSNGHSKNSGRITIPMTVAQQLGWTIGSRVDLMRGEGYDINRILVRTATIPEEGYSVYPVGSTKKSVGFNIPTKAMGIKNPEETMRLDHFVAEDGLILDVTPLK